MSKRRQAVFWVVLVAIIGAPVVGAELVLRGAGLGEPILFDVKPSYRYAPQPNQSQTRRRGAKVTIDSKGFRAVNDWTSPADGKILFIGDSVTWGGTYIDDQDTFAAGVCARLEQATGKRFVCGNAGTNEYGTDNMAERIRYKNVDDETALIVTIIMDDPFRGLRDADAAYLFTKAPSPPFRALWEASAFVAWRLDRALRHGIVRLPPAHAPRPGDPPFRFSRSAEEMRVGERSLQNLFAAIRETQRPGRKVLLVLSPMAIELNGHETEVTTAVRAILERSGFELLDLHAPVSAAYTADFYYDGVHLDRQGHRFYAEQIARRLLRAEVSGAAAPQQR
jgi:hypothetical protein